MERIADARQAFDDVELRAVEPAVDAQPRFIVVTDRVDDERAPLPACDGVAEPVSYRKTIGIPGA